MTPMPEIIDPLTHCPHCGHKGDGLQYAVPALRWKVQAVCLSCGVHGPMRKTSNEAAEAFLAGEVEAA